MQPEWDWRQPMCVGGRRADRMFSTGTTVA